MRAAGLWGRGRPKQTPPRALDGVGWPAGAAAPGLCAQANSASAANSSSAADARAAGPSMSGAICRAVEGCRRPLLAKGCNAAQAGSWRELRGIFAGWEGRK